jgi:phenylacetate-CoA ligase
MGNPLVFYVEKAHWLGIHFAFNKFYMKNAGYHSKDKTVSFCGIKTPIRYHQFFRTIECSSFHTSTKDFDMYNDLIHRFKPRYVNTFPSIFLLFTKDLIERNKGIYPNINAIFCHGEKISSREKDFLAETYDCEVYDQYGHREQCVFATTVKNNDSYQVYPEYGIIELIDEQNNIIYQKGKTGEIIATGLTSHIFPFIRYKTGDLSSYAKNGDHVLPQSLSSICGRTNDYVVGKNQEKIPFSNLHQILSKPQFHLIEYQIIQEKKGEIHIHYVQRKDCTPPVITELKKELRLMLNQHFKFTISSVEHIKKTPYGKQKYLIQYLPIHDF